MVERHAAEEPDRRHREAAIGKESAQSAVAAASRQPRRIRRPNVAGAAAAAAAADSDAHRPLHKYKASDKLGIRFEREAEEDGGVLVRFIEAGLLAYRSALRLGDVVVAVESNGVETAVDDGLRSRRCCGQQKAR